MSKPKNYKKQDAFIASLLRKATSPDVHSARQGAGLTTNGAGIAKHEMTNDARSRSKKIAAAEQIMRALPEMEMIVSVRTSTLLSTKDMVTSVLNYDSRNELPIDLNAQMTDVIREKFDKEIQLPKKLYKWLKTAQRTQGAVPVLMLSESGFDEMFNLVAREGIKNGDARKNDLIGYFNKQKGILSPISSGSSVGVESLFKTAVGMENPQKMEIDLSSLFKGEGLSKQTLQLTDNSNITVLPKMQKAVAAERAKSNYFTGGKSYKESPLAGVPDPEKLKNANSFSEVSDSYNGLSASSIYKELPRLTKTTSNFTDGTFIELSAAAVAPVRLSGNGDAIGYIVLLEKNGQCVSERNINMLDHSISAIADDALADDTIRNAGLGMGTDRSSNNPETVGRITAKYAEIAERKMLEDLQSATGVSDLSLSTTNDFYRIMLARHLAKSQTQVLYVPAENLSYFAVDYNEDGIGISIAEKSFVISTVRMAIMFATMNATTANAARHMEYTIEVSPDDANAQETVARATSDIMNSINSNMPIWGDMTDAYNMASNANIAFNVEGNEFYAPYKVSISDTTPDYKVPDTDLDDSYLRRTCNLAGVDPDLIMTPENIEFASQIYSKNLLVIQQTMLIQDELSAPLRTFVYGNTLTSRSTLEELGRVAFKYYRAAGMEIKEAHGEALKAIAEYVEGMQVTIPQPDTSLGNAQLEQFEKRLEFIQKLAEFTITADHVTMMEERGIKISGDALREMLVSFYMVSWCRKNGIEDNFFSMFDADNRAENVKVISDDIRERTELLFALASRAAGKVDTVGNKYGDEDGENDYGSDPSPSDSESSGGGDDEFSLDDDFDDDAEESKEGESEDTDVEADDVEDEEPEAEAVEDEEPEDDI